MSRLKNGRDANEAAMVDLWRGLGYVWIPMRERQGFDGLLITPLGIHIVEIKNPEYKWNYEPSELKLKEACERLGQEYHTIETMKQAEWLAGVIG